VGSLHGGRCWASEEGRSGYRGFLIVVSASLSLISLNMNKAELDVMRKILDIWPFLLFKRLALEERKKIRDLQSIDK
jgi:hypothetical protein